MPSHGASAPGITHTQTTRHTHAPPVQVNGGSVAQKVDFAYNLLEKAVSVNTVFSQNEASGQKQGKF